MQAYYSKSKHYYEGERGKGMLAKSFSKICAPNIIYNRNALHMRIGKRSEPAS